GQSMNSCSTTATPRSRFSMVSCTRPSARARAIGTSASAIAWLDSDHAVPGRRAGLLAYLLFLLFAVLEHVQVHRDPLGVLRLHARGVRPVGQDALTLRLLGLARELHLALLEVGQVRSLPLLEADDEEVVADRDRPRQRLLRRQGHRRLRDGVRNADALDDDAFGRRARGEQARLLDAWPGGLAAAGLLCVARRREDRLQAGR